MSVMCRRWPRSKCGQRFKFPEQQLTMRVIYPYPYKNEGVRWLCTTDPYLQKGRMRSFFRVAGGWNTSLASALESWDEEMG